MPPTVDRIVLAASANAGTFGQVSGLRLVLVDRVSGAELAGLAADFGIDVDGSDPQTPVSAAVPDAPAPIVTPPPPQPAPPAAAPPPPPPFVPPPPAPGPAAVPGTGEPLALRHRERRPLAAPNGAPPARLVAVDLDASVVAFDSAGNELGIVWQRHLNEFYGALQHTGDSREGTVQGDAERIQVELHRLPEQVAALMFTLTSFSGQSFTDLRSAYCRFVDGDTNLELARFELTDTQPSTAVLLSMLKRHGPQWWEVRTIGEFHDFHAPKKLVPAAARHVQMP